MPVYLDRLVTTLNAAAMTDCGRAPVRVQGANRPSCRAIRFSRHRRSSGRVAYALFPQDMAAIPSGNLIHSPEIDIPLSKRTQA